MKTQFWSRQQQQSRIRGSGNSLWWKLEDDQGVLTKKGAEGHKGHSWRLLKFKSRNRI